MPTKDEVQLAQELGRRHMMHPPFPDDPQLGGAVMYANLVGMTCSVCAPLIMGQEEVEAAAMLLAEPRGEGPWRAIDKSQPPLSMGAKTPSPCNVYPDRQHWFLVSW